MSDEPSWSHVGKRLAIVLGGGVVIMAMMLISASHPSQDDVVRGGMAAFISGIAGWIAGTLKT
jgi:hypothetical protein